MVLNLLLTAVRRDIVLGVRGEFDGPLAFDDRRALDLRGDRDHGNLYYLEGTMRVVAEAIETLLHWEESVRVRMVLTS